jgi:hypothetical protein
LAKVQKRFETAKGFDNYFFKKKVEKNLPKSLRMSKKMITFVVEKAP